MKSGREDKVVTVVGDVTFYCGDKVFLPFRVHRQFLLVLVVEVRLKDSENFGN
jgi:hypothetical protein